MKKVMIILEAMELPRPRILHIPKHLVANRIEPIIVLSGESKIISKLFHKMKTIAKVYLIPNIIHFPLAFLRQLFLNFLIIPSLLLIENPKLVILSVPDGSPLIPTFLSCKLMRKKLIIDIRDEWEEMFKVIGRIGLLLKKFIYAIYSATDMLIVTTPNFLKKYKDINPRTFLIYNSVDTNLFRPLDSEEKLSIRKTLNLDKEDFVLVYSGKLSPPYRIDVVLKSLKILKNKGKRVKLIIIGKAGYAYGEKIEEDDIHVMADKLDIKDMLLVLPFMDQSKLSKYLAMANAGVIPYDINPLWKNTIPIKFLEYCACGLPTIATTYKDSLLAKIINENKIGLTCDPLNFRELANAIEKLIEDKKFTRDAAKRAREFVKQKFDKEKIVQEFLNLVLNLIT
jgi:glycosyltransferase involved in cell wall biosynthesis